jgi:hypothetical protein
MNDLENLLISDPVRRISNERIRERNEHERAELQLINERDAAEDAFCEAYCMIVGRSPEFTSATGYRELLEDIRESLCPKLYIVDSAPE